MKEALYLAVPADHLADTTELGRSLTSPPRGWGQMSFPQHTKGFPT